MGRFYCFAGIGCHLCEVAADKRWLHMEVGLYKKPNYLVLYRKTIISTYFQFSVS